MSPKIKYISYAVLLLPVMILIQQKFFLPDSTPASLNKPHPLFVANIFFIILNYRKPMCDLSNSLNMKIVGSWAGALISVYLVWFIFFSNSIIATEVTLVIFLYLLAVFLVAVYPYFGKPFTRKNKNV